jgi:hypothetical protein
MNLTVTFNQKVLFAIASNKRIQSFIEFFDVLEQKLHLSINSIEADNLLK